MTYYSVLLLLIGFGCGAILAGAFVYLAWRAQVDELIAQYEAEEVALQQAAERSHLRAIKAENLMFYYRKASLTAGERAGVIRPACFPGDEWKN